MKLGIRKLTALLLVTALIGTLTACSGNDGTGTDSNKVTEEKYATTTKAADPNSEEIQELVAGVHKIDQTFDTTVSNTTIDDKHSGSWAIYWYLCGNDLESENGAATSDLYEMLAANLSEDVTVVVETGGALAWQNEAVDVDKLDRFVYSKGSFQKVDVQENASMGSEDTLENFLSFCNKNYPADNQMVLFWDHGGGSLGGACYDENYNNEHLTLNEMGQAVSTVFGENTLEAVGFDCCLMASVDTAKVFADSAKMLVASEEAEPGNGWYYTDWLQALSDNSSMSNRELGQAICDAFMKGCKAKGTASEATLSVIDLTQLNGVINAINLSSYELFAQAVNSPEITTKWARCVGQSENYGGNNDSSGYFDMVDIGDLVKNGASLLPITNTYLSEALQQAVVYEVCGDLRQNSHGLSIFYPMDASEASQQKYEAVASSDMYAGFTRYSISGEVTQDTLDLLSLYYDKVLSGTSGETASGGENGGQTRTFSDADTQKSLQSNSDALTFTNDGKKLEMTVTDKGYLSIDIGEDNIDAVKTVYSDLLYYEKESQLYVDLGRDDDVAVDWGTGIVQDNFNGTWPCMDGEYLYMDLSYEGKDYNLYSVPIKLNGEKKVMTVAYYYESNTYEMIDISDSTTNQTSNIYGTKTSIQPKQGDKIIPIFYFRDENTNEWTELEMGEITYSRSSSIRAQDMGDSKFVMMYEVEDMKGNFVYSTNGYLNYQNGQIQVDTNPI